MDLGFPENGLEYVKYLQTEDEPALVGELNHNFSMDKEKCEDQIYDNAATSTAVKLELNHLGQYSSPSLRADFKYEISESPPEIFDSHTQTDFRNGDIETENLDYSKEKFPSPLKDGHHHGEMENFPENNHQEEMESFPVNRHGEEEMENISESDRGTAVSPHDDKVYEDHGIRDSISSQRPHEGNNENVDQARNSPTQRRQLDITHSDHSSRRTPEQVTGRQVSVSPKRSPDSPCVQQSSHGLKASSSKEGAQGSLHSPKSHRQEHLSPARQRSRSPSGSRQRSHHKDGKRKSVSPRPRYSSPHHRRKDRSLSRSPIRRRDTSSVSRRGYRDRSRSRSPYVRDHHRRSPRGRFSPRRRSPGYHSRYRSPPRRKQWSPPSNRSTGIGKPGRNLFVAGFSFLTTERDLERKFSRFGRVRDVRIVRDNRSGDSRGFGFLSLERDEDADAAIRALDKTEWNGRIVLVEKSKGSGH